MNIGDPNMDMVFRWSRDFPGTISLPPDIERNYDKLVEIVGAVDYCLGREFAEDVKSFEQKYSRLPDPHEQPFVHPPLQSYDSDRKNMFINCVKEKTRTLLEMDDNVRVNMSFRLWSGCLMTSKEISARTQTGPNTSESRRKKFEAIINPYSQTDTVFRAGQKISPFFKRKVGQGNDVFFDGIPDGSAILEVKDEFENNRI